MRHSALSEKKTLRSRTCTPTIKIVAPPLGAISASFTWEPMFQIW